MSSLTPVPPTLEPEAGPEPAVPSPPSGPARRRIPVRAAIAAMILGAALAFTWGGPTAVGTLVFDPDPRKADALAYSVGEVRLALEEYGTDFNGSYPLAGTWTADLAKHGNEGLPGQRLPRNPWAADAPVLTTSAVWPAALPRVGPIARGEVTFPPIGTDLGPGRLPGEPGPPDALVYGTLLYDYDPDSQVYVLYAIGKKGGRAVLVGATSNGSC